MRQLYSYIKYRLYVLDKLPRKIAQKFVDILSESRLLSLIAPTLMKYLPGYYPAFVYVCYNFYTQEQSSNLIKKYILSRHKNLRDWRLIRRVIKQSILIEDIDLALEVYEAAQKRGIKLPLNILKEIEFRKQNYDNLLYSRRNSPKKKLIKKFYPSKYVDINQIEETLYSGAKIALLTTLGPGDEVDFSCIYKFILEDERIDHKNITIIGDYRLHSIYARTYPELNFVPTKRVRHISGKSPYTLFSKLPNIKLHSLLCNESEKAIFECEKVIFNLDLLYTYRSKILENERFREFIVSEDFESKFAKYFEKENTYIGLCWSSSINNSVRKNDYFSLESFAPLFEMPEFTFVSLQHQVSKNEVRWVQENYPGKLLIVPDVDMYNDFESMLSIIKSLHAVVSVATFVAPFSAKAGAKVFLLATSREIASRKMPNGHDLWDSNVSTVDGDENGDKKSLIDNLRNKLRDSVQSEHI